MEFAKQESPNKLGLLVGTLLYDALEFEVGVVGLKHRNGTFVRATCMHLIATQIAFLDWQKQGPLGYV